MTLSESIREAAVDLLNAKYPHVPPTTLHDIVDLVAPVLAEGLMREVEELEAEKNKWIGEALLSQQDRDSIVSGVATVGEEIVWLMGGRRIG